MYQDVRIATHSTAALAVTEQSQSQNAGSKNVCHHAALGMVHGPVPAVGSYV